MVKIDRNRSDDREITLCTRHDVGESDGITDEAILFPLEIVTDTFVSSD